MFDIIRVPRGYRAVVNGQLEPRTRFHVGKYVPLYFVAPSTTFETVSVQARCKEGIVHKVLLKVAFSIKLSGPVVGLEDLGFTNRSDPLRVDAQNLVKDRNMLKVVEAAVANYVNETSFLALTDSAAVTKELKARVPTSCSSPPLSIEVEHCEIDHVIPNEDLLAEIAAVGMEKLVAYFRERIERKEIIAAELEEARAKANARLETAKADVKIAAINQNERIKVIEAGLEEAAANRSKIAKERNGKILELGAALDFAYKLKRIEEENELTTRRELLAQAKAKEEAAARLVRELDLELEIKFERERADIRKAEKAALLGELAKLPRPDTSQGRIFVGSTQDPVANLMASVLATLGDLTGADGSRKQ